MMSHRSAKVMLSSFIVRVGIADEVLVMMFSPKLEVGLDGFVGRKLPPTIDATVVFLMPIQRAG